MAVYHVSATGSQDAPYDTEGNAIHNTALLKATGLLVDGDTVLIDSDITEPAGGAPWTKFVTVKSTKAIKPIVTCEDTAFTSLNPTVANPASGVFLFENLHISGSTWLGPAAGSYSKLSIINCKTTYPTAFNAPLSDGFEMINSVVECTRDNVDGMRVGELLFSGITFISIKNNVFTSILNTGDVDAGLWILPFMPNAGKTIEVRDNIFTNSGSATSNSIGIFAPSSAAINVFKGNVKYSIGEWLGGDTVIDVDSTNIVLPQPPNFVGLGNYSMRPSSDAPESQWRTFGTEYMSGIDMLPVGPWTFFVGANGSNTYPFDTAAKAARDGNGSPGGLYNIKAIYARNGDIIELVAGDVIDASQAFQGQPWFHNITIRSWSGNNGAVPVVQHTSGAGITFFHDLKLGTIPMASKISGFKIISKAGTSIVGAVQLMVAEASQCPGVNGLEVSDMIFDFSTATYVEGICYFDQINKTKPLLGDGLKFNNNLVIAPNANLNKGFWLSNINANNATLEIKSNTIVCGGNAQCLFLFGTAQPSTLQNVNISQNIIQVNDPEYLANSMYLGANTNTIKGIGVKNNIVYGTKMINMASPLECVIAPGTSWFLNTMHVDPMFTDMANGDYSTPKGPQPSWGWQGWRGPTIAAEPFNLKHYPVAMRHIIGVKTSLAKAHGKTRAAETPFTGVLSGMCVGVTASGTFKKLDTYADGKVTKFVLATSSVQSLTDSSSTLTTCESMGVPLSIPKAAVAGGSMTYGEPVVAVIGGEDAGKVTTLDLAIPGSYTVVGACLGDVPGGFLVETVQQYKVVK